MATKLNQALAQLETAGALLTVSAYMRDADAFMALALMNGAAVKSEWVDEFGKREISMSFEFRFGDSMVCVVARRTPTLRDWSDLAEKRDARDPKAVRP